MRFLLIALIFIFTLVNGESLDSYKDSCEQIGFKKGTSDFGNCVLELRKKSQVNNTKVTPKKSMAAPTPSNNSEEAYTCRKYGFSIGSEDYNACIMNLDLAKQQALQQQKIYEEQVRQYKEQERQYNEQKRLYEEQLAKAKSDKEAKDMFNLLMYGLNRVVGDKTHDEAAPALYGLPAYPKQPRAPIMPMPLEPIGGRTMDCHWDVWRKVYRCQ